MGTFALSMTSAPVPDVGEVNRSAVPRRLWRRSLRSPLRRAISLGQPPSSDHLGSVRFVVDFDTGSVVSERNHLPSGAPEHTVTRPAWDDFLSKYGYSEKRDHRYVELSWYGARFLAPNLAMPLARSIRNAKL